MQKRIFISIFSLVCGISGAMFERPQTPVAGASFPFRRHSLLENEICVPLTYQSPITSSKNGIIEGGNIIFPFMGALHSSTLASDIEINVDEPLADPHVLVANTDSPERILMNDCNLALLNMIEEERLHRCEIEQTTQQDNRRSVNQHAVSSSVAAVRIEEEIVEPHSYSFDLDEGRSTQDDVSLGVQTSFVTPVAVPSPIMNATIGAQIADEVHQECQSQQPTLSRSVTPLRINAMGLTRTVPSRHKISSKLAALNDRLSQPALLTRLQSISRKQRTNLESPIILGQRIKFSAKLPMELESEINFCMQAIKIWLRVVSPNEKRDTFFAKIVRHLYIATEGLKGDNINLASRLREYNYMYGPSDTGHFYDDFDKSLSKSVDTLIKICSSANITSSQLQEKVTYISSK